MEIFDVFSMNGIENFLENVILKVSQTHFSKDFYPKGGHKFFKGGGQCPPPLGGAVKYPDPGTVIGAHYFQAFAQFAITSFQGLPTRELEKCIFCNCLLDRLCD